MSGPGINPLAFVAPDLYAKQLAIQRRQALAQTLMEQGQAPTGSAAYGGLRNAGNAILGAILAKRGDQDMANLYSPQQTAQPAQAEAPPPSLAQSDVPEPQISNNPGTGPTLAGATPPAGNAALGAALQNKAPAPAAAPQPQRPQTIPQAMNSAIQPLPGLSPLQSTMEFFGNNAQYWKALNDSNALTDQQKQIIAAFPGDPQKQAEALQGVINKAGTTTITRGMGILPDGRRVYAPGPAPTGYMNQQGPGGPDDVQVMPMQGGQQAVAGNAFATNLGRAASTPVTGYGPDNMPVASNAAIMSGNAPAMSALGIGAPPPPAAPPPGPQGNAQPSFRMQNPGATIGGIIGAPVQISSADRTPGHNAAVGGVPNSAHLSAGQAYDFVPQGISASEAAQRLAQSGLPFDQIIDEGDHVHVSFAPSGRGQVLGRSAAPSPSPAMRPELPQGVPQYLGAQGKDAADRHDATVAAAQESPMRINVLDNIINLSKAGVATGPGQDFQQNLLGYAANVPGLSKLLGGAKDNVAKFQELQKFTYQNAIRSWQAAGGTGTDSQMEAMSHANPNDHLFPQALQGIAQWGKAAELAVQGKANAQDRFLAQNGQTPSSQIKFENTWRNAFDPKAFQYATQDDKAGWLKQNGITTPQAAKALLGKVQALRAMGALQ